MPLAAARIAAFDTFRRISSGETDLPDALAASRARLADERDRALAAEILTGTLRFRGALDFLIERYAARPLTRLDAEVIDVLRLSGYQILHLSRVPVAAVVDDAVELTRRSGKASAAGFVNAVLRAFCREREHPPLPQRPSNREPADTAGHRRAQLDYLSITGSHPRWLVRRWLERHGFEQAETWTAFNNAPAAVMLRVNPLVTTAARLSEDLAAAGVIVRPARFAPLALSVVEGQPLQTPLAATGAFVVQDEASQLVCLAASVQPGQRVLDCCAAPGGKTTAMAAEMTDRGSIVAADIRQRRVALLRQAVAASRSRIVRVVRADLRQPPPFRPVFDVVLVDAPCSGLGTLRRDPDLRWRRVEEDLPELADDQRRLLASASEAVRPGGRLVYATCSSEPEENEQVVEAFLSSHPYFRPVDMRRERRWHEGDRMGLLDDAGRLRTLPHLHGLEAFFAAALECVAS